MIDFRSLPVYQSKELIIDSLKNNQVIIVESPTGSGKTTQIPVILQEAGYTQKGIIGITQPRRIATLSVSEYITNQLSDDYPTGYCAYKMRFYDTTNAETRIKILTDGMLLQELKTDPLLAKYSVIMVDEAHERSLNIDFILGWLKQIITKRNDLKIIISSATINTSVFSSFFNNAPIISIKTRQYNVQTKYYPVRNKDDIDELSHSICQILNHLLKQFSHSKYEDNQDTLVFLSGESDIKHTLQAIYSQCDYQHLQIYPLYGRMNKEEQEQVFEGTQPGKMKVVLATNIAETSLTIENIRVVIDSGLAKINYYNQINFTSSLITKPISVASAKQRLGRAGRTSDGICYRLYSEEDLQSRPEFTQEEILRTDLSEIVLRMCDLGIYEFETFPFITKPDFKALKSGELTLKILDAIDDKRHLTPVGEMLVKYPLLPRHARCIYEALKRDTRIIKPVIICVSFLSCKTPFLLPAGEEDAARIAHRKFADRFGDFIGYQILYNKYTSLKTQKDKENFCDLNYLDFQCMDEIVHVTNQLCDITRELGIPDIVDFFDNSEEFARECIHCVATGMIQYICVKKRNSTYRTINTDEIFIHPGSAWFREQPSYIVAGEIVQTSKMYARTVSPIKPEWIMEISKTVYDGLLSKTRHNAVTSDVKHKVQKKAEAKKISLYGKDYETISDKNKKAQPIAVIPFEDIRFLYRKYLKASRHPKSFNALIKYKNYSILYGEKLRELLIIGSKLSFNDDAVVHSVPDRMYTPDNLNELKKNLKLLMKFSPLKKYPDRLGFIEILISKNVCYFHVNKSFNDAINNNAYSLLTILDNINDKDFSEAYNKVIKYIE